MLEIKNFSKKYGDKEAVSHLSFVVNDGDIMGFVGKNGAGKTTTLKACMGIITITEGEMYITLYIWPKYFSDYKIGLDFYDEANSIWEQVELTSDMELMNTDDLDDAFVEYILQLISDYQNEINKIACRICLYRPATFLPCHHQAG